MHSLFAQHALLPTGWSSDVLLQWEGGTLQTVTPNAVCPADVLRVDGPLIPGMVNLHSHAFQHAFAGLTEYRTHNQDSFWTWRDMMYRFAARLDPVSVEAIATWLYVNMVQAGYTHVCEFHYLHHQVDGRPYADDAAMSLALMRAAKAAGIGMTLLPVLYQNSGFGSSAPTKGQQRFIRSNESLLTLLQALGPTASENGAILGVAPHSLRAVSPDSLRDLLASVKAWDPKAPVHIHIAEQQGEVDACLAWSGQRPVQWLMNHVEVDAHWCLVHATHLDDQEILRAAATGAVVGLCPSTEANLGDGLFRLSDWRAQGGRWGIGSDSHVCVNAAQELMLLEYGQRLHTRQRNVANQAVKGDAPYVATAMLLAAVQGGAQASGLAHHKAPTGLVVGQPASWVELDSQQVALQGLLNPDQMVSAHVFASDGRSAIRQVWVRGTPQLEQDGHPLAAQAARAFVTARSKLLEGVY